MTTAAPSRVDAALASLGQRRESKPGAANIGAVLRDIARTTRWMQLSDRQRDSLAASITGSLLAVDRLIADADAQVSSVLRDADEWMIPTPTTAMLVETLDAAAGAPQSAASACV